tara:strand:- start:1113 stop:1997 length:885 start_codon:yes stop_codon:yes gene_type:complete
VEQSLRLFENDDTTEVDWVFKAPWTWTVCVCSPTNLDVYAVYSVHVWSHGDVWLLEAARVTKACGFPPEPPFRFNLARSVQHLLTQPNSSSVSIDANRMIAWPTPPPPPPPRSSPLSATEERTLTRSFVKQMADLLNGSWKAKLEAARVLVCLRSSVEIDAIVSTGALQTAENDIVSNEAWSALPEYSATDYMRLLNAIVANTQSATTPLDVIRVLWAQVLEKGTYFDRSMRRQAARALSCMDTNDLVSAIGMPDLQRAFARDDDTFTDRRIRASLRRKRAEFTFTSTECRTTD